jgi:hypothetical protein
MSDQDEESRETHPAYGMIGFSRVTNGGVYTKHKLFGSSLDNHPTTIRLQIKHAERQHGLGHDRYYAKGKIVEVELSAGQFAELLTTMNMGDGVPCTIRYADGKPIEEIPAQRMEVERVREGFEKDMKRVGKKLRTFMDSAKETLAKKNLTKDDREQLMSQLRMFVQEMESNVPFALTSFEEATDKVVNHAKAEVDAFMTTAVMNAGFKSLALQGGEIPPVPMFEARVSDEE